ncbi:class A beta-lactamase [Streptacidiphilus melanogenes]|uniref:class A beta-lactamase n=1 Tax=Streptacidiphilus melanogenes TaxID=411235 RepID=UPI000694C92C|nr:class A beta-lactamase [Streptacidiphilus melanogenes]
MAVFPSRRGILAGTAAALAGVLPVAGEAFAQGGAGVASGVDGRLRALEQEHSARVGVFAYDSGTGRSVTYRAGELFPMCSTWKTLGVAAVLRDLDRDGEFLAKVIHYTRQDVTASGYAPITGLPRNVADGMTVGDLCAAALEYSDNGAANLLLRQLGGPQAVTRFCRSVGDRITRLDRWEPELNSAEPGRVTDTSTPRALGLTCARLTLGGALDATDRKRLTGWLLANTTGAHRLRAGLPADWVVADKTGTGEYGTANDVGIVRPPGRGPIVMAVLSTKHDSAAAADEPLVAGVAALLAAAFA